MDVKSISDVIEFFDDEQLSPAEKFLRNAELYGPRKLSSDEIKAVIDRIHSGAPPGGWRGDVSISKNPGHPYLVYYRLPYTNPGADGMTGLFHFYFSMISEWTPAKPFDKCLKSEFIIAGQLIQQAWS